MKKSEIIQRLAAHGIYQLNKGETAANALDYIDGRLPSRIGYQVKTDASRMMDKNEIIAASWKEGFRKTLKERPEYQEFDPETVDLSKVEDTRSNLDLPGILQPCQYCGKAVLTDDEEYEILNCEDCMGHAIWDNCM